MGHGWACLTIKPHIWWLIAYSSAVVVKPEMAVESVEFQFGILGKKEGGVSKEWQK